MAVAQTGSVVSTGEAVQPSSARTPIPFWAYMGKGTVSPQQRKDHAAIARYMFENYSQVSYAVGLISRYSAPVYPQADSVETDWNELALTRFLNWAKRCDWSGRYDLWTMQRIASNLLDTDGECAFWLRDSDDGVKIDLVEAWQIYTPESKEKDPLCVDGVQLDKCGRITGYWVEDLGTSVFVDAGKIKLLSHPGRYSALRAESPMRQGINDLRDANDIKAFQKQAVKLDSIIASYINVAWETIQSLRRLTTMWPRPHRRRQGLLKLILLVEN